MINSFKALSQLFVLLLFLCTSALAQEEIVTLEEIQSLAQHNYPMAKTTILVSESGAMALKNLNSTWLPSIAINAQYSYQSDVTSIPINIPNLEIPTINKEQYKMYADISQVLYDGRLTKVQRDLINSANKIEVKATESELYKITQIINQMYFSILLIDGQLGQTDLLKVDIKAGLQKAESAYKNGIALQSAVELLKAEQLKLEQREIEYKINRKALIEVLSVFTNKRLTADVKLEIPLEVDARENINRPEIKLIDEKINNNLLLDRLVNARNNPRLNAFFQGGYGNPALNMLDPNADTYFITGLRMTIPFTGFYNLTREKSINKLNRQILAVQKETFLFNLNVQLIQQKNEADKYRQLIMIDKEISTIREKIKDDALAQLENGVITSADYIREVNALDNARQMEWIHTIQLLMSVYSSKQLSGNQ